MPKVSIKRLLNKGLVWLIVLGVLVPPCVIILQKGFAYCSSKLQHFFTPTQATCTVQNVFDQEIKENIEQFVISHMTADTLLNFKADDFLQTLKQKFQVVRKVEWKYVVPQTLHLTIVGSEPWGIVNDQYVLGQDNQLFSMEFFKDINLNDLPKIYVNQTLIKDNGNVDRGAADFIYKINAELCRQNRITYHSPSSIELVPHQSICKCRIVTDPVSFFDQQKFDRIDATFTDLCKRGLISKKMLQSKKALLAFDFRFKNQIIVKFSDPFKRGGGL